MDYAVEMYKFSKKLPRSDQYEIGGQLRRSSFSVPNNLAEGGARKSNKEQARFTETSYSSLMEVMNILIFSNKVDLLSKDDQMTNRIKVHGLSNQINALYNAQKKRAHQG